MATYLKFHQLERSPFEGRGDDPFVLATASLRRAYAEIRSGMEDDSPRICLSGGSGIGKSSFARALPKLFESDARCALVLDPTIEWNPLEASIAGQLQLDGEQLSRASLIASRHDDRRILFVIDRAEDLSTESLEHLDRVLGYRDDAGKQLVQCILLANLEDAPQGREIPLLWWLDQLATLQLRFSPIPENGLRSYIDKHLEKAGFRGASIFDDEAVTAIYRYTGGVPGAVGSLCEKLLSRAAEQRNTDIDARLVARVCGDERAAKSNARPDVARTGLRAIPVDAPDAFAETEPELKIQQGLVHMDEPQAWRASSALDGSAMDGGFSAFRPSRLRPSPPRHLHQRILRRTPKSRRSNARGVRNLIGIALLACIAMLTHLLFFAAEPVVSRLTQPIPPTTARLQVDPPKTAIDEATAVPEPATEPQPAALEIAMEEPQPETILELEEPAGLTSDLRLDPSSTNVAALAESSSPIPELLEAIEEAAIPSTSEISQLADAANEKPAAFEPWAEQAPEPASLAAPAAPAPLP